MSLSGFLRSKTFTVLLGVLVVVGVLWVALPVLVTSYVNGRLARLENYTGHVDEVSLDLWNGAYRLTNLRLDSREEAKSPFLRARAVDLSIETGALLKGSLVAEVDVYEPVLNYVARPRKAEEPTWQETMEELTPFRIDRFEVHGAKLTYRGGRGPTLRLSEMDAVARNLTNSSDLADSRFARFEGRAKTMGSGALTFQGRADPSAATPTFDLELDLEDLKLKDASQFLTSRSGFRAGGGTLDLDADLRASGGRVDGVANTVLRGLRLSDVQRQEKGLVGQLWERARGAAEPYVGGSEPRNARVRVPIDFRLDDPRAGLVEAANEVVQTAITRALEQSLRDALPFDLPGLRREN
jgi:hypothetical protein